MKAGIKEIEIGVSIPEMMNGCVKKLNLTRKVFCKKCDGKGVKEGARDSTFVENVTVQVYVQ